MRIASRVVVGARGRYWAVDEASVPLARRSLDGDCCWPPGGVDDAVGAETITLGVEMEVRPEGGWRRNLLSGPLDGRTVTGDQSQRRGVAYQD
jgi:hypothetical protein